ALNDLHPTSAPVICEIEAGQATSGQQMLDLAATWLKTHRLITAQPEAPLRGGLPPELEGDRRIQLEIPAGAAYLTGTTGTDLAYAVAATSDLQLSPGSDAITQTPGGHHRIKLVRAPTPQQQDYLTHHNLELLRAADNGDSPFTAAQKM